MFYKHFFEPFLFISNYILLLHSCISQDRLHSNTMDNSFLTTNPTQKQPLIIYD